ncbi:MAG: alpha/beta hydrolase [Bacteroidetes bacterium]|nr:MAG: alpha/beta hydrolase [Bacteroidota bacterium]
MAVYIKGMKNKRSLGLVLLLVIWVIWAQSCMFFRTSDRKAGADFTGKGIPLKVVYRTLGGYTMHYVQVGADSLPTLVFVHGSPGSWDAFKGYLQDADLRAKFRLIAVDRPGFGYSSFGAALNLEAQAALLKVLLQGWQNGAAMYLVGHSLGGPLVVELAAQKSAGISGLVLLAAALDPALEKPEKWRKLLMNNPLEYLVPGAMRPSNYELWYLKADLMALKPRMASLALPIWMLHGTNDQLVPYANVAFAQQHIGGSWLKVTTLEGANHFIPWSHYAQVKQTLLALPLVP